MGVVLNMRVFASEAHSIADKGNMVRGGSAIFGYASLITVSLL